MWRPRLPADRQWLFKQVHDVYWCVTGRITGRISVRIVTVIALSLLLVTTASGAVAAQGNAQGPPCDHPGEGVVPTHAQGNYDENTDNARENRGTGGECDNGPPAPPGTV